MTKTDVNSIVLFVYLTRVISEFVPNRSHIIEPVVDLVLARIRSTIRQLLNTSSLIEKLKEFMLLSMFNRYIISSFSLCKWKAA